MSHLRHTTSLARHSWNAWGSKAPHDRHPPDIGPCRFLSGSISLRRRSSRFREGERLLVVSRHRVSKRSQLCNGAGSSEAPRRQPLELLRDGVLPSRVADRRASEPPRQPRGGHFPALIGVTTATLEGFSDFIVHITGGAATVTQPIRSSDALPSSVAGPRSQFSR
jgi:hypothetical protein